MPKYDLEGQTAVITGGGGGIGRAISLRLAREGVNVIVADIVEENAARVAREAASFGVKAVPARVDVTVESQVEKMVADAVARFGRLDIMCANAGISVIKPLIETDEADWDLVFDVNAKGVFFCDKHAARQMIKQGAGRIINTASVVGKSASRPDVPLGAYTASKHAVIGLTRSFGLELAPYHILVNCVCPAVVDTDMLKTADQVITAKESSPTGSLIARFVDSMPLGRILAPEDVAAVVAFLCSSDYSIDTGQAINISAGTLSY